MMNFRYLTLSITLERDYFRDCKNFFTIKPNINFFSFGIEWSTTKDFFSLNFYPNTSFLESVLMLIDKKIKEELKGEKANILECPYMLVIAIGIFFFKLNDLMFITFINLDEPNKTKKKEQVEKLMCDLMDSFLEKKIMKIVPIFTVYENKYMSNLTESLRPILFSFLMPLSIDTLLYQLKFDQYWDHIVAKLLILSCQGNNRAICELKCQLESNNSIQISLQNKEEINLKSLVSPNYGGYQLLSLYKLLMSQIGETVSPYIEGLHWRLLEPAFTGRKVELEYSPLLGVDQKTTFTKYWDVLTNGFYVNKIDKSTNEIIPFLPFFWLRRLAQIWFDWNNPHLKSIASLFWPLFNISFDDKYFEIHSHIFTFLKFYFFNMRSKYISQHRANIEYINKEGLEIVTIEKEEHICISLTNLFNDSLKYNKKLLFFKKKPLNLTDIFVLPQTFSIVASNNNFQMSDIPLNGQCTHYGGNNPNFDSSYFFRAAVKTEQNSFEYCDCALLVEDKWESLNVYQSHTKMYSLENKEKNFPKFSQGKYFNYLKKNK